VAQLFSLGIIMERRDFHLDSSGPDFDIHPIWYCRHGDNSEVDFVFEPAIGAREVTRAMCQSESPCIPLRVENTELWCLGYYDIGKDTVFSIAIWMIGMWRGFSYIDAPRTPVIVISQVPILGVAERRFLMRNVQDWYAERIDA
jgi:hypothetical protein